MNKIEEITKILNLFKHHNLNYEEATIEILNLFNIKQELTLEQDWQEDPDDKTGWSSYGWFYPSGHIFKERGYDIKEVLDTDKYGHIIKAVFKYIG